MARVAKNTKKRKADAVAAGEKTAAENEAIAATGDVSAALATFESEHGETYVALERPQRGPDLKKARIAKRFDDGSWKLGRIKDVTQTAVAGADGGVASYKHSYRWKASTGGVEIPKLKLHKRAYGTDWVHFDLKKAKN